MLVLCQTPQHIAYSRLDFFIFFDTVEILSIDVLGRRKLLFIFQIACN